MRRILVLLIAVIVCAEVAQAGDVKVEAVTTASPGGEGTTNFAPDVPELFAMFKTKGAQSGDKLRGVWIAEDVGSAAPANSKIDEKTLTMDGDTDDGDLSLSKPTKGWPVGKYRFEIYVNDKLVTTTRFTIEGNKEEESAESTNLADSADSAESQVSGLSGGSGLRGLGRLGRFRGGRIFFYSSQHNERSNHEVAGVGGRPKLWNV